MTTCLTNKKTGLRVSSVLRRAVKEFGPKHLVDDEEDTCWNSDQYLIPGFSSVDRS
ncbi:nuclear receptor 2C2-associated protein-like isoform X2 [Crassostrea virginica]